MPRISLGSLVAATLVVSIVPAARAQSPNTIGRYLGVGWSDGYHARTACPPKPQVVHHRPVAVPIITTVPAPAPTPAPVPWWKIPATPTETAPAEPIPSPAQQSSAGDSSSGRSLYRQPGEASSMTGSGGPGL